MAICKLLMKGALARRNAPEIPGGLRAGMGGKVFFANMGLVYMGVDLGGGKIGMPQHFLDNAQVRSAGKHMGRIGMT